MIKTALITNADIVKFGVCRMLATDSDISLIAVADSVESYISQAREAVPDVIIVDIQSLETPRASALQKLAGHAREVSSAIGLIGLTDWTNKSRFEFARSLGANGFCLKTISDSELVEAVTAAACGDIYMHADYHALVEANSDPLFDDLFGKRQFEVLDLVAQGYTNREIAESLQLSVETVKSHIKVILNKLGAKDRSHAISIVLNEAINVLTQQNLYFNSNARSSKRP